MKSRGPWEEGECDEKPSHVRPMSCEGSALLTFCFCGGDGWINQEIGGDREPSEFLAAGRQSGKKSSAGRTTGKLDARLPVWGRVEGVGTQVGRVAVGLPCYLTRTPTCREGNRDSVHSVWRPLDPIIFWATSTHSTDLPTHSLPCAVLSAGELDVRVSLSPRLHSHPH